eukprot:TRINITY_DN901_c0_g1_i2.p1 TRINITY_DN901_c0_g1~~TRINITY_DN901_c0_g1_i2.p1  ORF type:complete len:358 (+),score=94.09 TRINITY_DN901_c0_g1_i2:92-1165(+)
MMMEHRESSSSLLKEQLLELIKIPGNASCADCMEPSPQWASVNLGVFICIGCAGIHRNLSTSVSRVKSVVLDTWKQEEVSTMASIGNEASNKIWEAELPRMFVHPSASDSVAYKEQWIKAKYVRKMYSNNKPADGPSSGGSKESGTSSGIGADGLPFVEGWMIKKGEVVKHWRRRWFRLHGSLLGYYKKHAADEVPKGVVCLAEAAKPYSHLDLAPPDKPFTFIIGVPGRDYLLCTETGEAMYEWITALKTAWAYLCRPLTIGNAAKAIPEKHVPELAGMIAKTVPTSKKKVNGKVYPASFYGSEAVDVIIQHLRLESRQEAITLGQELMTKGVVKSCLGEPFHDFTGVYQFGGSPE